MLISYKDAAHVPGLTDKAWDQWEEAARKRGLDDETIGHVREQWLDGDVALIIR